MRARTIATVAAAAGLIAALGYAFWMDHHRSTVSSAGSDSKTSAAAGSSMGTPPSAVLPVGSAANPTTSSPGGASGTPSPPRPTGSVTTLHARVLAGDTAFDIAVTGPADGAREAC